jgi:hypothetical protein
MAAAAIASGAVPPPDAGEPVAGVAVTATVTGTATAIGLGVVVVAAVPSGDVGVEPSVEAVVELSPDDDAAVDFAESSFEPVDLVRERGGASAAGPALASEAGALLAS